jgi:hypothetical protein
VRATASPATGVVEHRKASTRTLVRDDPGIVEDTVPARSPSISTVGLDQAGKRGQPSQLSLATMMSRHLLPLT